MPAKVREKLGDVIEVPLTENVYCYARILSKTVYGFYDIFSSKPKEVQEVILGNYLFKICVMKHALTSGRWKRIGNVPLASSEIEEHYFYKKSAITGKFSLYRSSDGASTPSTFEECKNLECAAVWDPEHVEERLWAHYRGIPSKFAESLKPRP